MGVKLAHALGAHVVAFTTSESKRDDAFKLGADEVVLIDLTPEALIQRLQAGKIYPAQNIDAALNNFFKIENLAALREVSLRQVAEDVESKRLVYTEHEPLGTRVEEKVAADAPMDGPMRFRSGANAPLPPKWRRSRPSGPLKSE